MMPPKQIASIAAMLVVVWLVPLAARGDSAAKTIPSEQLEFFEKHVRPLLAKRCFGCHGGTQAEGGLSLATSNGWQQGGDSGPAIVPGRPEKSLLIDAITYRSLEMPPADEGGQMPADEIAVLSRWVAMGAPDPRSGDGAIGGMTVEEARGWWSFQPLPAGPELESRDIDALLEREWLARHLAPTPPADRRTLIRRATYDVTGLPPTAEETRNFLADNSPDAYARLVDRLLESPQYGVRWGRHWLDVVRYADTAGENTDRPLPHAWRYRNWVFEAFRRDMPFDQFAGLQLAGDLLTKDQPTPRHAEGIVATGYLAIARRFGHDIDADIHLMHEDAIDNLGKSFLGLTVACARCHDHKYDPINAADYYALYGILESARFAFPGCEPKGQPRDLVPLIPQAEVDAVMRQWRERHDRDKQMLLERAEATKRVFSPEARQATQVVQSGAVAEGATVDLAPARLAVRKGEVVLLAVEPNASHGADTTLVELWIRETAGPQRKWSTSDIIDTLTDSNPREINEATWSFIELTKDGPVFLLDKADSLGGNGALKKWSLGDIPSVLVNSADQQVMVWTTLPAESFFVHPGPNRPVAIAWTSPLDGEIAIEGRVADVHPTALDGVTYRLEHIASPATGLALVEAGRLLAQSVPAPEPPPAFPVAYAVVDREVAKNAHIHERGDPEKIGDEVPRRWLAVFGGNEVTTSSESGRRELAAWITGHPLFARVIVNRIWGWHFGRGIVASANDFGARGERPTHPELLDRLAAAFASHGFSVKSLHRLVMLTDAYQRASATPVAEDPDNRWLAHFSRRRLDADELRDSLLAVSGRIDLSSAEAHPFPSEETWKFTQHSPFTAVYETNHRSPFQMVQRQRRHPFLSLFDGADPNASTPGRQTTTVPTQALYFMNDSFFHEQAAALATRLTGLANDELRTTDVFHSLFQRDSTAAEHDRVRRVLTAYKGDTEDCWAAVCRVLLASNEFLTVE
ncbi:MAG: PSD1 and planctomycete cytochrome C domain-containing protein [Pirellulales bacterium]